MYSRLKRSTTTFDETVIAVDSDELVLANPVISLAPFPLNEERYQRWFILKNEQGVELSRGWLDAVKGADNVVILSTVCEDEDDCAQNDGDFCNGVGKCGSRNICVVEDGCGLPSCVEVVGCSTDEVKWWNEGRMYGRTHP
ncbi:MAG: hypothetical protein GY822_16695 [Deltaproteobacteria bacterium]|nr:hypothetical protein [Deltaproteobacteria bacterium]